MAEAIPSGLPIQRARILTAFTEAAFEPLIGATRFSEFNSGQSDRFAGVYTFIPLEAPDIDRLVAWILRLKHSGTFFAYDPKSRIPLNGIVSGLQYASHAGDVVSFQNGPLSTNAVLSEGDYIQIDTQYFKLLGDLDTDGSGDGSAQVWPSPRSGLTATDAVVTDHPVMLARITSPAPQETDLSQSLRTQLSISWEQAV